MKKFVAIGVLGILCTLPTQGHCFMEYIFGGSAMNDAIGNNVVGDLRAWWTGNPVYTFNPYYNGGNQGLPAQNANQAPNFQAMPQQSYAQPNQQPQVTYYPSQGQQPYGYPPQAVEQQPPMQQQRVIQPVRQQPVRTAPQPQARYQPSQQQRYQGQPQQATQAHPVYQQPQAQGDYQQGQPQAYYPQEQSMPGNRLQTYQYEQEIPSE